MPRDGSVALPFVFGPGLVSIPASNSPDAFKLALGRRYNRTKKAAHGRADRDFSADQIDTPKTNTAAKLAAEHSVSEATVKRAGWDGVASR